MSLAEAVSCDVSEDVRRGNRVDFLPDVKVKLEDLPRSLSPTEAMVQNSFHLASESGGESSRLWDGP
jgi:hypothetical protein